MALLQQRQCTNPGSISGCQTHVVNLVVGYSPISLNGLQTFNLYNATSFSDEALRLRQAKNLPMPSASLFDDAFNFTASNFLEAKCAAEPSLRTCPAHPLC